MKTGLLNEVKNKHSVNSEQKKESNGMYSTIPDEINRETCLNCPLPRCKSNCGLLKGEYPK